VDEAIGRVGRGFRLVCLRVLGPFERGTTARRGECVAQRHAVAGMTWKLLLVGEWVGELVALRHAPLRQARDDSEEGIGQNEPLS
jgi:hypothetical protein